MTSDSKEKLGYAAQAGAKQLFVRYGLGFLINITGTIVIARQAGPDLWGMFAISQVVLTVFVVLSQGCWGYIVQNRTEPGKDDVGNCYSLQTLISLAWIVLVLLLSLKAPHDLLAKQLLPLLLGTVFGGFFYGWRYVVCGLSERDLQYRVAAIAELSDIVVFNGIAVPLSLAGYSYYGILIGNIARGIASLLIAQMASGRRLYFSVNSETMTRIARFSIPYSGFVALQWLPIYAGPVVAGLFLGVRELGLLQLAYKTVEYPRVLVTVASRVSMSFFSRIGTAADEIEHSVKRTIDVLYLVLVPAMGLLVALGPVWIPVIYGRQWLPMSNIMLIILFPHLAMAMMMILSSLMSAQGNSRGSFIFYGVYNCIYWSALIVLTPHFGFLVFPFTEWIALAGCLILLMELRSIGFDTTMVWKYAGALVLAVSGSTFLWTIARYRSLLETVILTIAISALWVTMSPGRREIIRWAKL